MKGLVKSTKISWVKSQGLDKFFLDIDVLRKMYSSPELIFPDKGVLGRSFGDTVYRRFLEAFNIRLSKGCLVVLDAETESTNSFELLASIYGYTVFFVIQDTPKDYIENQRRYNIPYYGLKKRTTLEHEVEEFKNFKQSCDKLKISKYQDVVEYWNKKKRAYTYYLKDDEKVLHVSDLHSNYELYKKLPKFKPYRLVVFHGDYIDGPEEGGSRKLMDMILFHSSLGIVWLEGNHELRLRRYLGSIIFRDAGKKEIADMLAGLLPADFGKTAQEFSDLSAQGAMKYLQAMNERLKCFVVINTLTERYVCTHAGVVFEEQLTPMYVGNVIYCGRDMNKYDRVFSETNHSKHIWSVHAHCKYPDSWEVLRYPGVVNLDPPDEYEVVYGERIKKDWSICQIRREE